MTNTPNELDTLLDTARRVRAQREDLELALDKCRREARVIAIALIFDHGYSLNKCSSLTGHMRPTLRVWVEAEIARRADLGLTSPKHV